MELNRNHYMGIGMILLLLGLQFRFLYFLNFDVRFGLSYLVEQQEWKTVFR